MQRKQEQTVRFREEFPARTDELQRIREQVEAEATRFGFDRDTAGRLALAADEACTNIIRHSYSGNASHQFVMEIATLGDRFMIILTDHGRNFDPTSLPPLDMKQYFERCARGGLGVHIIKLVMDDVDYAVVDGGGNQLRMIKRLPTP